MGTAGFGAGHRMDQVVQGFILSGFGGANENGLILFDGEAWPVLYSACSKLVEIRTSYLKRHKETVKIAEFRIKIL